MAYGCTCRGVGQTATTLNVGFDSGNTADSSLLNVGFDSGAQSPSIGFDSTGYSYATTPAPSASSSPISSNTILLLSVGLLAALIILPPLGGRR